MIHVCSQKSKIIFLTDIAKPRNSQNYIVFNIDNHNLSNITDL